MGKGIREELMLHVYFGIYTYMLSKFTSQKIAGPPKIGWYQSNHATRVRFPAKST